MNDNTERSSAENAVAQLLKLAGQRDMPDEAAMLRARTVAYTAWQQVMQRRMTTRRRIYSVMAACVAAVLLISSGLLWRSTSLDTLPVVAHIEVVNGDVSVKTGAVVAKAMSAHPVFAQTQIATGNGRIALTLPSKLSLRLNQHTQIVFVDTGHVRLLSGELYVDAGLSYATVPLLVDTPAGAVMHRGTQYRVVVSGDATLISVREGSAQLALAMNHKALAIGVGEELRMEGGRAEWRTGINGFSSEWRWVADIAPKFNNQNSSLGEYLRWFARERGFSIQYQSEKIKRIAFTSHLHGAVTTTAEDVNLDELSLITGMSIQVQQGVIHIASN